MSLSVKRTARAALASLLIVVGSAAAQWSGPGTARLGQTYGIAAAMMGPASLSSSVLALSSPVFDKNSTGQSSDATAAPPPPAVDRSAQAEDTSSLRVGSDPAVSAKSQHDFLADMRRTTDAASAQAIAAAFQHKDVRRAFGEAIHPYGFHENDYADVLTAYLVVMWMGANQAQLPTPAQAQAARRQIHALVGNSAATLTPAQRQAQAEAMMYETVLMIYARQEAERKGDRAALASMAQSTQQNFASKGFDLRAIVLNERGLVRR